MLGFHAERIEKPADLAGAITRGLKVVTGGQSALIEFMARVDIDFSLYTEG
jgi:hypothetical protein